MTSFIPIYKFHTCSHHIRSVKHVIISTSTLMSHIIFAFWLNDYSLNVLILHHIIWNIHGTWCFTVNWIPLDGIWSLLVFLLLIICLTRWQGLSKAARRWSRCILHHIYKADQHWKCPFNQLLTFKVGEILWNLDDDTQCFNWSGMHRYDILPLLDFILWCTVTFHKLPVPFPVLSILQYVLAIYNDN